MEVEENILCHCFHVPEAEVREAVKSKELRRVSEVTECTGAGGGCFSCWPEIETILRGDSGAPALEEGDPESRRRFRKLVEELLERELDPLFSLNGIRATILDVEEARILVQFEGSWTGKPPDSFEVLRAHFREMASRIAGREVDLCEGRIGRDEETGLPTL